MRRTILRKKRKKLSIVEKLHKELWKKFSQYVRQKSKGLCYTCGERKHWKEMDASHYIHGRLDYDERNIHACCVYCNRYLHGNLGRYAEKLITELGEEGLQKLRYDANQIKKWSAEELKDLIKKL